MEGWQKGKWNVTSFGGKKENVRREKKIKRREKETTKEENRTHVKKRERRENKNEAEKENWEITSSLSHGGLLKGPWAGNTLVRGSTKFLIGGPHFLFLISSLCLI